MSEDILSLNVTACLIFTLSMPVLISIIMYLGFMIDKQLRAFFPDKLIEQRKSVKLATGALLYGTVAIFVRFIFQALTQQKQAAMIDNMVLAGSSSFAWYYFFVTLLSDFACYCAVVFAAYLRVKHDWEVFLVLSVKPKPEQDILVPL